MKRILIIDDEREFCGSLKEWLEAENYEVAVAYDGKAGLERARKEKPGLILLDILMPQASGLEVLTQLRVHPETSCLPVVMLTAKSETIFILASQELKANDYLIKPFKLEELLKLIGKYFPD